MNIIKFCRQFQFKTGERHSEFNTSLTGLIYSLLNRLCNNYYNRFFYTFYKPDGRYIILTNDIFLKKIELNIDCLKLINTGVQPEAINSFTNCISNIKLKI